ncbi:MAG: PDZ domain-containing protein [Planctomycetaceae bacterium]|nr:PDZ domain-containing protein [Planctomycetaceae bacterium]MDG1807238.1 trypsin-like peptidase domain-containing protein [Pirellulaceae bacterium]MDG2104896.1 trypsin-like peptidase domain-containing protein [Pirellulaceae bacterium]
MRINKVRFFALAVILAVPLPAFGQTEPAAVPSEKASLEEGLLLAPKAFRLAAEQVRPALVAIESFGGSSTVAGRIGGIRKQGEGNTTGIMISPDGYVITSSFNFIQQPTTITVITSDGKRRIAQLKGRDDTRRICLLKIEGVEGMPVPEFISPEDIRVGQWAISVGVGYGDKNPALSTGIVSAKNRMGGRAIQTDANVSPANYGGPLLDITGQVIGICVPMSADSRSLASGVEWYDSGIGFCIPVAGNESLLKKLKLGEHVQRAFLGVATQEIKSRNGIRIVSTLPGAAAEKAGLQAKDIVLQLGDSKISNLVELRAGLDQLYAGDKVELVIEREGKEQTLEVELGAPIASDAEDVMSAQPSRRRPGPGR